MLGQRLRQRAVDDLEDADLDDRAPAARRGLARIEERALACLDVDRADDAAILRQQRVGEHLDGEQRVGARVVDVGVERDRHLVGGA